MTRYNALALRTSYWKPNTDYIGEIVKAVKGKVEDWDFVVVSEKAIATAKGCILDESKVEPGLTAKLLAKYWMPIAWGYFIGVKCHFGRRLLRRLREYPYDNGSKHKQAAINFAGLPQALMFGSEGGIDGSNLPYSFVSLPLLESHSIAKEICDQIRLTLGKSVGVVIVDTDKTYTVFNFHFTPRPKPLKGIKSRGGIISYVAARALRLRKRPTPLAISGVDLDAETALTIANVADRARGPGSGATVWDMASRFKVSTTGVSWDMLNRVIHKPIVIVRKVA